MTFGFVYDEFDPLNGTYDVDDHYIVSWTVSAVCRRGVDGIGNDDSNLKKRKLHPKLYDVLKELAFKYKDWYAYNKLRKYVLQEHGNSTDFLAKFI